MPRSKTLPDAEILAAALDLMHAKGPEALTFAALAKICGLSASTLVQRFRTKADLVRAALLHAWDRLDAQTTAAAAIAPRSPGGAIEMLTALSHYGGVETYADGLLLLREDLRDPVLRARGAAWKASLTRALDDCFAETPHAPANVGLLLAAQWQGALIWWSFDPQGTVETFVQDCLTGIVRAMLDRVGS